VPSKTASDVAGIDTCTVMSGHAERGFTTDNSKWEQQVLLDCGAKAQSAPVVQRQPCSLDSEVTGRWLTFGSGDRLDRAGLGPSILLWGYPSLTCQQHIMGYFNKAL
jgi:hypothetical protein